MALIKSAAHIVMCPGGRHQIVYSDGSRGEVFTTSEAALDELDIAYATSKVMPEEMDFLHSELSHLNLTYASEILEASAAIFKADEAFLGRRSPVGPTIVQKQPSISS